MNWSNTIDSNALGVPLSDLLLMLETTSLNVSLNGNIALARHEHYTVRVEVVPPENREDDNESIQAVVRVITDLPRPLQEAFKGNEAERTAILNPFAALGALYSDGGTVSVGSRLTIYECEDAWRRLHLPLLAYTTLVSTEAILGSMRRMYKNEEQDGGASEWAHRDLAEVEGYLSRFCVCTTGGKRLVAEFGLAEGEVCAAAFGHQRTALFELMLDQPHLELTGGLFCLLQMPHRLHNQERLHSVCLQLNSMEMAAHDLPPHFGAWCPGKRGDNPAYVSFLPNPLHEVRSIAVNAAIWARARAHWANLMLASMGIRL